MSLIDPKVIRSEKHATVGELLQINRNVLIERWARRAIEEQPTAPRVHHDVLLDHLNELLEKLGEDLKNRQSPHVLPQRSSARKHGEQRWEAGWSLPEVIRDFQILRLVILEFLMESLPRPLGGREILAIGLAIDEAIAASVNAYVDEGEGRRLQQERKLTEEQKDVQKRLQAQAAALREADQRKNEFLAVLAHELRNPLAPVHNALQILRLKSPPDKELVWAREIIERQTQHMARLVDDLLDVSRIARGKVKIEKEPNPVSVVVERAVEEVRPLVDSRNHQLHVSVPSDPLWIEADRPRVVQILVNLLVNAAKYTDAGGQLHLNVEREGGDVVFAVRDNGIGIPAELMPRIFEPFVQEEQSKDRATSGLGIGLALVRQLVDLHGGRVHVSSAGRGMGSEFRVHLPALVVQSPPVQEAKASDVCPTPARRILVVDDNKDAARSLAFLLSVYGHDVKVAHDGSSALELAKLLNPEIILLDIGMPQMDGLEVARRLRLDLGLKHIRLVAVTGYGQDHDRLLSKDAGFSVHLVKPLEIEHLNAILRDTMPSTDN